MRNNHTSVEELQRDAVQDNLKGLIRMLEKGVDTPNTFWLEVRALVERVSANAAYIEQEAYRHTDKVTAWKTGRNYSPDGQRIAAEVLPNNLVAFTDLDRGIDGITKKELTEGTDIKKLVMRCYDAGFYTEGFRPTLEWAEERSLLIGLVTAAKKL